MPSPQANQLTRQHRSQLGQLATRIAGSAATIAQGATVDDVDLWWDENRPRFATLAAQGFQLSAQLGARYMRQHAALEAVRIDPVQADIATARLDTALQVAGPVAFKKNIRINDDPDLARRVMSKQLRGTVTRMVLAGSRDTATATVDSTDRIVGWRRVTAGQPCAFCAMVASRGAVYKSSTALQRPQFHDHDRCTYEPLYQRESEPGRVVELRRQWEESTDGLSGTDALNAFRTSIRQQGLAAS